MTSLKRHFLRNFPTEFNQLFKIKVSNWCPIRYWKVGVDILRSCQVIANIRVGEADYASQWGAGRWDGPSKQPPPPSSLPSSVAADRVRSNRRLQRPPPPSLPPHRPPPSTWQQPTQKQRLCNGWHLGVCRTINRRPKTLPLRWALIAASNGGKWRRAGELQRYRPSHTDPQLPDTPPVICLQ